MSYREGEDVMIARTSRWPPSDAASCPSKGQGGLLNLHHDRHKSDARLVTFMVYLSTVDSAAGHGGETYFPAAQAADGDDILTALQEEYNAGSRLLARDSPLASQCNRRLQAWREARGYPGLRESSGLETSNVGVGTAPNAGVAVVFDAVGPGAEAGSWHGPCAVTGPEEKWTLTFFKSPAPVWSSAMLGL